MQQLALSMTSYLPKTVINIHYVQISHHKISWFLGRECMCTSTVSNFIRNYFHKYIECVYLEQLCTVALDPQHIFSVSFHRFEQSLISLESPAHHQPLAFSITPYLSKTVIVIHYVHISHHKTSMHCGTGPVTYCFCLFSSI